MGMSDADILQLRAMTCELGLLQRPDGSSHFNQGDMSILAAVYGPGEVQIRNQLIDRATVEVTLRPKVGLPRCAEKFQERLVRNTCETVILASLYPRSCISVVLQEMQNSGSLLACSINASCLALLDAAVPMKYMIAAVSCVIDEHGQTFLDPTLQQEAEAIATFCFAFNSTDLNTVSLTTKGSYTNEQFQSCLLLCKEASKTIFQFYTESMKRKLCKELK